MTFLVGYVRRARHAQLIHTFSEYQRFTVPDEAFAKVFSGDPSGQRRHVLRAYVL